MNDDLNSISTDSSISAEHLAKREDGARRIRANLANAKNRVAARLNAHLDDHGAEYETSAEDFLRETDHLQSND